MYHIVSNLCIIDKNVWNKAHQTVNTDYIWWKILNFQWVKNIFTLCSYSVENTELWYSSKVSKSWQTKKDWGTITDWYTRETLHLKGMRCPGLNPGNKKRILGVQKVESE